LLPNQIEDSAWCEWAFVDAMERADGSGLNGKVRTENGFIGAEEGVEKACREEVGEGAERVHGWGQAEP
jgi:hypothetical protein